MTTCLVCGDDYNEDEGGCDCQKEFWGAPQSASPLDDMVMREFPVVVPCVGDRPLLNAVGSNETEASVNVGLIDLTDDEMKGMTFKRAKLIFHT